MNFFGLISSAIFLFGVGLAVLIGIMRGRKYKWEYSLARIIGVVVSAILSALLATVLANLLIDALVNSMLNGNMQESLGGELGAMLQEIPSGISAITAFGAMLVAPVLFIPLFIIVKIIVNIIVKLVMRSIFNVTDKPDNQAPDSKKKFVQRKRYKEKDEHLVCHHANYIGAALGAVCSVLVLCVFLVPLVGALDVVDGIYPVVVSSTQDDDENSTLDIVNEAVDGVCNNAATFTVKLVGGKYLYGLMTTTAIDGEMANINKEADFIAAVADTVVTVSDKNIENSAKAKAISSLSPAFDKTVLVRVVVTDVCSAAGTDWNEGRAFHGINKPSFGKDLASITDAIIKVLATSNKDNVKSDFKAITEAVAVVVEDGLAGDVANNPMAIISKEETTTKLFAAFLQDERFDPVIDGIADFGVGILLNSVKTPEHKKDNYQKFLSDFLTVNATEENELVAAYSRVFANYAIRVEPSIAQKAAYANLSGADMNGWLGHYVIADRDDFAAKTEIVSKEMITVGGAVITDREHEAAALSHAFAVVYGMTSDIKGNSFEAKKMLATMGPALDSFALTETIGKEKTALILETILQSELVHNQLGFTTLEATDSAISIAQNAGNKSYESIMKSLSGVVEMLEAASDKTKNTKQAVDKMLQDLTPEAASVMEIMATPSVMQNYGVPERSADASATMISTTFGNLKDVPPEEYEKESAAVANMMNVMISVTDNTSTSVFGGADSATQMTEEEYVNNIMESSAMSKSVVETVYGNGDEPKNDPLNSGRKLSEGEKNNLVASLDAKWQASEKDETTKREIISIAAIMNLPITVTDAAVIATPVVVQ